MLSKLLGEPTLMLGWWILGTDSDCTKATKLGIAEPAEATDKGDAQSRNKLGKDASDFHVRVAAVAVI